jgi:NAD(P)-dependent dehydrogenase (short-subunit alcohol dehydrogenase family)
MHVVITGGAGFLGRRLARALLARPTLTDARGRARPISALTLLDVAVPAGVPADPRLRVVTGDLADERVIAEAVREDTDSVFHLAAVVSGEAEAEIRVHRGESSLEPLFEEVAAAHKVRIACLPSVNWREEGNRIIFKGSRKEAEEALAHFKILLEKNYKEF